MLKPAAACPPPSLPLASLPPSPPLLVPSHLSSCPPTAGMATTSPLPTPSIAARKVLSARSPAARLMLIAWRGQQATEPKGLSAGAANQVHACMDTTCHHQPSPAAACPVVLLARMAADRMPSCIHKHVLLPLHFDSIPLPRTQARWWRGLQTGTNRNVVLILFTHTHTCPLHGTPLLPPYL